MLTQWFDPEPNFKGLIFAKELVKLGYEVEVLTGFPNYPGGKIYDGYKIKLYKIETLSDIRIIRVPLYPSHSKSAFARIINYISFALSASILGSLLVKKMDIIYVYHPPVTVGLAAILLKYFKKAPIIYDIQDLWPDSLTVTGMLSNVYILKVVNKICNYIYSISDQIVVLSPGFKNTLSDRGVSKEKIHLIYNWCDLDQLTSFQPDNNLTKELNFESNFNIIFAGNIGVAQALDTVLKTAAIIMKKYENIRFILVGDGIEKERLKKKTEQMGLNNVFFLPRMRYKEVGKILSLADILLVHLKDDPLFRITIPSKTQAYMAFGKPILMAVSGDAADLIIESKAGCVCKPENDESLAYTIKKLYNMTSEERNKIGNNGKQFYQKNLSIEAGTKKFAEIFNSTVSKKSKLLLF
jgi:colanic acid biosynthesis glycosyl transferase WcaI